AVRTNNVNLPTGTLYGPNTAYTVQANGQLFDAKAYENVIIAWRDGRPVRLNELGKSLDSVENDKTAAWYIDRRAVVLAVQKQPGTNTVAVVQAVRKLLPLIQQQIPASVSTTSRSWRSPARSASSPTTPSSCSRTSSGTWRWAKGSGRPPSRAARRSPSPSCR